MPSGLDLDKLRHRFLQFGGWSLLWQYAKMGVLWCGIKALIRCVVSGASVKTVYPSIIQGVEEILVKRYRPILDKRLHEQAGAECGTIQNGVPRIVWCAWLQGIEQAPALVKACIASQKRALPDYEFRFIDRENYRQWTSLPRHVVDKFCKGKIPPALFSDLLRLSLLTKYGGIWMDASVYCSGFGNPDLKNRWERILSSELTLFRYFEPGRKAPVALSNWFIATVPGQRVLSIVLEMLLAYWQDFECTVDYYICHLYLVLVLREFPSVFNNMPRANSRTSLLLSKAFAREYSEEDWQKLTAHVSIHKLNYRKEEEALRHPNSYCRYLLNQENDV